MPRVFRRRQFPAFSRSPDFPHVGTGYEWPPLATSPEPNVVHEIITNVIEVPCDDCPPATSTPFRPTSILLGTASPEALGTGAEAGSMSFGSQVMGAANRAFYVPFTLWETITAVKMFVVNGTTVSGNVDVGLYNESGTRLVSAGSTAQAGTSSMQEFDIADTSLAAGRYYLAVAIDNNTGTFFGYTTDTVTLRSLGVLMQDSAFPLPASATFATLSIARTPVVGLSQRTALA